MCEPVFDGEKGTGREGSGWPEWRCRRRRMHERKRKREGLPRNLFWSFWKKVSQMKKNIFFLDRTVFQNRSQHYVSPV